MEEGEQNSAQKRISSIKSIIGLLVILGIWVFKTYGFFYTDSYNSSEYGAVKAVVKVMSDPPQYQKSALSIFAFVLLFFSNLRIGLGYIYCNRDSSFVNALKKTYPSDEIVKNQDRMIALVILIYFIAVVRSLFIAATTPLIVPILLLLEASIIIAFDIFFSDVFKADKEVRYNTIIRFNDVIFFFVAVVWVISATVGYPRSEHMLYGNLLLSSLTAIYVTVFVFEYKFEYSTLIDKSFQDFRQFICAICRSNGNH